MLSKSTRHRATKCLFLVLLFTVMTSYKRISLGSLEPRTYKIIKEHKMGSKFSYVNYYDLKTDTYIKIWNPEYFLSKNFQNSLSRGYYHDITPLKGVIYDDQNRCCGYVTKNCPDQGLLQRILEEDNPHDPHKKIVSLKKNHPNIRKLIKKMMNRTKKTGYFYTDLRRWNFVSDGKKLLLIDLEEIYPLSELDELFNRWGQFTKSLPEEYSEYIICLYENRYGKLKNLRR